MNFGARRLAMSEAADQACWEEPGYVKEYLRLATDPAANRYEYEVNLPSLLGLVPEKTRRLLDYGCSAGYLTSRLAEIYERVDGCDASEYSIKTARHLDGRTEYFVWDGENPLVGKEGFYDVVLAKLVLPFVEELPPLVENLSLVLRNQGCVIVSAPHPFRDVANLPDANYFEEQVYSTKMGGQGLNAQLIHRSLTGYIQPFLDGGFSLDGLAEPVMPPALRQEWMDKGRDPDLPVRLNMRFSKLH